MKTLILTVGVVLLAVSSALAQTDRGTITGTVLDPAGAVVPNASIEAKNTDFRVFGCYHQYRQFHSLLSTCRYVRIVSKFGRI